MGRYYAVYLRFDHEASQHLGTLPLEPNFGCVPRTPDLRSIGWRSRKQDNAAVYTMPFISFLASFHYGPCIASNLPESSGVCRGQLSPILQRLRLPRHHCKHELAAFSFHHATHPCIVRALTNCCMRYRSCPLFGLRLFSRIW